jgi:transposase-like protein
VIVARSEPERTREFKPGQIITPEEKARVVAKGLALEAEGLSAVAGARELGISYPTYRKWTSPRTAKPKSTSRPAPTVRGSMDEAFLDGLLKGLDEKTTQEIKKALKRGDRE